MPPAAAPSSTPCTASRKPFHTYCFLKSRVNENVFSQRYYSLANGHQVVATDYPTVPRLVSHMFPLFECR